MKSYDLLVQSLYDGILADAGVKYPDLRKEFSRDYLRLCSALKSQGLSFFTITLPTAGKHFDKCLAGGRLVPFALSHLGPKWKGLPIPRLFGKLVLRVFERSGDLRIDADILAVRILRQLFYVAKKLRLECTDERTFSTIEEFYQIDREVRPPSLDWDGDDLGSERAKTLSTSDLISDIRSPEFLPLFPEIGNEEVTHLYPGVEEMLEKLQKVADLTVASDLGVFDPYAWKPKHGPGVVSDRRQGESKYDFPFWPRKLDRVFPMADFGFANFSCWVDAVREEDIIDRFSVNEKPSKLIAVPKTQKGPRLIAAEPAAHQWCQQILLDYFFTRVRNANSLLGNSIHFRDQSYNQRAALEASQTGQMMTVDLSSASDRVSCWLVERLFRRSETLLDGLHATRTRWISNEIDKKSPRAHVLRKFSCMGSACTFPVQSIIFWMIAVTSLLYTRREAVTIRSIRRASKEVRVFGDDIILPTDAGEFLDFLTILGFKVNHSKTFLNGRFRESCGLDGFRGHDVTPVYVLSYPRKARPESITSAVESVNNLVRGGWPLAADRVKSIVLKEMPHLRLPTLPIDSGYFGWKTPYWMDVGPPPKQRWNDFLHRAEFLVHVVVTRVKKLPDRSGSRLLQYFTEAPSPMIKWESGVALRPKVHLRPRWVPARQ